MLLDIISEISSKSAQVKLFKNEPYKNCGRQPLKNFTWSILEYLDPYLHYTQLRSRFKVFNSDNYLFIYIKCLGDYSFITFGKFHQKLTFLTP